jgi:hypothetical protein
VSPDDGLLQAVGIFTVQAFIAVLREALIDVRKLCNDQGPIIRSERGGAMTPMSIVVRSAELTKRSALTAARRTRAAGLSHEPLALCTRQRARFAGLLFVLGRRMLAGQAPSGGDRRKDLAPQP